MAMIAAVPVMTISATIAATVPTTAAMIAATMIAAAVIASALVAAPLTGAAVMIPALGVRLRGNGTCRHDQADRSSHYSLVHDMSLSHLPIGPATKRAS